MIFRYHEQAVLIGPGRSLLTIAALPARLTDAGKPAVVFLNTGIVHRVGHNRMYVTLARLLAERGHIAVRFDSSGIGDSPPRSGGVSPVLNTLDDIRTVLDWLETVHGKREVILMGLCSGADHAVLYGHTDPRVVGLILMDPSVPPTARYYLYYVLQRLGNLRSWKSVFTGRSGMLMLLGQQFRNAVSPSSDLGGLTLRDLPFSPYLRQCYRKSSAQGIRLLTVFTSNSARQTYHRQILDAFPEAAQGGSLRLEYFAESDHTFSQPDFRSRLFRHVIDWLRADDRS